MTPYMQQRLKMKQGLSKTTQQQRTEDREENGNAPIARKSTKKIAAEKEAKKSKEMTVKQFMDTMVDCAPELCMETGVRLNYKATVYEVICHILPKRSISQGGVPSQAKNPLNIVYLNVEVHNKMDKDLGPKSKGEYVRSMKIYSLLKERVKAMWPTILKPERKNIPTFLKPE